MDFYWVVFGLLAAAIVVLLATQASEGAIVPSTGPNVAAYRKHMQGYVVIYSLMMLGDWLQGPYVYALYEHYGFTVKDIGRLFIAGFGSSMIFGTVVGSLADKHGRKKAALLYVVTYALSCFTKHSPDYWVLMAGRVLGGIATSLLFSAFESWVVAEHFGRGFDEKWLGDVFSKAVFSGNGLMAILAGLVANTLVGTFQLGPVAPFDASATVLVVGGVAIALLWGENYGDPKHQHSLDHQFKAAAAAVLGDQRVGLLGAMQSLFEASMYTFVFLWTPALSPHGEKIPHGMIFACFMAASMVGSVASALLMKRGRPEFYMKYVFGASGLCLAVPFLFNLSGAGGDKAEGAKVVGGRDGEDRGISLEGKIQLAAFCGFEVLVGVFWPSMMTMRAHYVPEELRSTIINFFRIPLNLFVCVILYNVHLFPLHNMFLLCALFMAAATACQVRLEKLAGLAGAGAKGGVAASAEEGAALLPGVEDLVNKGDSK
uniref:Molybdate-anion transporter n=1 Tax=Chlamydomonas leiostraca TaxID=1034604 RepID=A0A7S0R371_9CHLO|mmetsp:Transcript_12783/g.31335  ORF Transcript_12783/g.31335 Transcript_12783/m.31335 type:complete len:487 (+) Transcript_12783:101-1561(+)